MLAQCETSAQNKKRGRHWMRRAKRARNTVCVECMRSRNIEKYAMSWIDRAVWVWVGEISQLKAWGSANLISAFSSGDDIEYQVLDSTLYCQVPGRCYSISWDYETNNIRDLKTCSNGVDWLVGLRGDRPSRLLAVNGGVAKLVISRVHG